jgi:plasmid stabilization system protein ParE
MKPLRCVSTPAADLDAEAIAEFYAQESGEDLVVRFLLALDEASEFIRRHPDAGSPRRFENPRLKGLRSWPVPGFEDVRMYYLRSGENTLRIVRILHGKRDINRILEREP